MHKIMITSLLTLLPLSQSLAVTDNDLRLCSTIGDNSQRLACFDNLVKKLPVYNPNAQAKALPDVAKKAPQAAVEVAEVVAATPAVAAKPVVSAQPVAVQSAAQPVAKPVPVSTAEKEVEVADTFGIEHKITKEEEQVQVLALTISKAKKNAHGYWFLTFENGQKWQTISTERAKFKAGQQVKIERGIFNSFNATVVGSNRTHKVKRLK